MTSTATSSAPQRSIAPKTRSAPSTTAIQNATLVRLRRNQRPPRVVRCSRTGCSITAMTLPARCGDPDLAAIAQCGVRCQRLTLLGEEPVDRGAGARHVRAEGPSRAELWGERRGGEVVRRQQGELAERQAAEKVGTPLGEALCAAEAFVDGSRRRFLFSVREQQHDPVVLRQVEGPQLRSVSLAELRPNRQEEGDIRTQPGRDRAERAVVAWVPERPVGEAERGGGVRAPAAETRGHRDLLVDLDM